MNPILFWIIMPILAAWFLESFRRTCIESSLTPGPVAERVARHGFYSMLLSIAAISWVLL